MTDIKKILEQRTRLEDKIRKLGGTIPKPWEWDDGTLRNLQLLELVEELQDNINKRQSRRIV